MTRKNTKAETPTPPALDLDDDFDLPLPPARSRRRAQVDDDGGDPLDTGDDEPIPFTSPRVEALEKIMQARSKGKPLFPYPLEMPEIHRPYWLELVNSFPTNHFTAGDIPLMKLYVRCAHDVDRCNKLIEDEGDVIMGPKGPTVNPRVRVRAVSEGHLMTLATKFRAQPASRQNTDNFQVDAGKAQVTARAGQVVDEDEDGLLAGGSRVRSGLSLQ